MAFAALPCPHDLESWTLLHPFYSAAAVEWPHSTNYETNVQGTKLWESHVRHIYSFDSSLLPTAAPKVFCTVSSLSPNAIFPAFSGGVKRWQPKGKELQHTFFWHRLQSGLKGFLIKNKTCYIGLPCYGFFNVFLFSFFQIACYKGWFLARKKQMWRSQTQWTLCWRKPRGDVLLCFPAWSSLGLQVWGELGQHSAARPKASEDGRGCVDFIQYALPLSQ